MVRKTHNLTKFSIFVFFTAFWDLSWPRGLKDGRPEERWLNDLLLIHTMDYLTQMVDYWHYFSYSCQIISKIEFWVLAGGRITKAKSTDITSKLHHDLSGDVANHRVALEILCTFHLAEWNFEYDMFHTTARFVWYIIIFVGKFYNVCNVNNTCPGRLIHVSKKRSLFVRRINICFANANICLGNLEMRVWRINICFLNVNLRLEKLRIYIRRINICFVMIIFVSKINIFHPNSTS